MSDHWKQNHHFSQIEYLLHVPVPPAALCGAVLAAHTHWTSTALLLCTPGIWGSNYILLSGSVLVSSRKL